MKLFYKPGACSLASHITLRESGKDFTLEGVDLMKKRLENGDDFFAVNPKGQVPALMLDDGTLLTEGVAIMQYLADSVPDRVERRNFSHRNALNYAPQQTSEKPLLRTVQIKTPRSLSHSNDEAGNLR